MSEKERQGTADNGLDFAAYFAAAALLDAFDPFSWQPDLSLLAGDDREGANGHGPLDGAQREVMIDRLLSACEQIIDGPLSGLWRMTFSERRAQLRRLGTSERMLRALQATPPHQRPSTAVQRMLERLLAAGAGALDALPRDDLAALVTVQSWLNGILTEQLPPRDDLLAALGTADLLAPMQRLLRHGFVNRERELAQLRQYVKEGADIPFFVYGSGGIGKSTLLAQFIVHDVQCSGNLFAYIDIDRPTIRPTEPLTFLLEIINQIQKQMQFPADVSEALVGEVMADIGRGEVDRYSESIKSVRGYSYLIDHFDDEMLKRARSYFEAYSKSSLPDKISQRRQTNRRITRRVVIIIDTFEEAQWFGQSVVRRLLDFIFALNRSELLRVIISGRVLPDEYLDDAFGARVTTPAVNVERLQKELDEIPPLKRPLNLAALDEKAARLLLRKAAALAHLPPLTAAEESDIIQIVSSNPMCLKLAVRMLQNEGIQRLRAARRQFLADLRAEKIQALLYGRILNNIKKKDVRSVAYPGLIVRRISPEVIREVLAVPCQLKLTAARDEYAIFADMQKEAALVVFDPATNSLRHRPDVRRAMLQDLNDNIIKKETIEAINRAAVAFYARFDDGASRAEEIYHRLRLGEEGAALDARWLPEAAPFLKDAVEEMPARQRLWLAKWWPEVEVSDAVRLQADQEAWEEQARRSAENYLSSADAGTALKILEERDKRLPRSPLYALHAEAYRVLGSYDKALQKARQGADALINDGDINQALELLLMMVVIEEARGGLAAADAALYEAEQISERGAEPLLWLRTRVLRLRLERKLRPDDEAHLVELRRRLLHTLDDDDLLLALRRRPVLLRETAAELAAVSPALAELAVRTLGLETTTDRQAAALAVVLTTLVRLDQAKGEGSAKDAAFLEKWRSSEGDPAVVQKWVQENRKFLEPRLIRRTGRAAAGSDLLNDLQAYFRAGESIVLADVGETLLDARRTEEARKIYEQALETMRRSGDRAGEAQTLGKLAVILRLQSEPDMALDLYRAALSIWRELGDRAEEARTLYDMAVLLFVQRRYSAASEPFEEALALYRALSDDVQVAMTLRSMAILHSEIGEPDQALADLREVLAIYEALDEPREVAQTWSVMGEVQRKNGRLASANQAYWRSIDIWRQIGSRSAEADVRVELAGVAEDAGEINRALVYFEGALTILRELGAGDREAWVAQEIQRVKGAGTPAGAQGDITINTSGDLWLGEDDRRSGKGLDPQQIYFRLGQFFNLQELEYLTFMLGINPAIISSSGSMRVRARELVSLADRRGMLGELYRLMIEMRPEISNGTESP